MIDGNDYQNERLNTDMPTNLTNWDRLNLTIGTIATTFGSIWQTTHSGGGSSTPVATNPAVGTGISPGATIGNSNADNFQYVTLGVAGVALITALFLMFKGR